MEPAPALLLWSDMVQGAWLNSIEKVQTLHPRAKPRLKVFCPTEARIGLQRMRVHLLDLSTSGALVHHDSPPPIDTIIRLECSGSFRSAKVVWRQGARFGVKFVTPLSEDQVAAALRLQ